jgi:hypothetical protein
MSGQWGDESFDLWAQKIRWIRTIWREEFGPQAGRVIMVVAGQEVNPWVAGQLVQRLTPGGPGSPRHFDALATTAYFGGSEQIRKLGAATVDQLIGRCRQHIADKQVHRDAHGRLAATHGVPYLAYEAGPHVTAVDGGPPEAVVNALNRSEAMYDLLTENMRCFADAGGSMYVIFQIIGPYTRAGPWGHLESMSQSLDRAPKYRALLDFVAKTGTDDRSRLGPRTSP